MPGENLDLSSDEVSSTAGPASSGSDSTASRRYVGIRFACCDVYVRVYVNREGTAYQGHCPRCTRRVELKISPDGSSSRFFTAY